MADLREQQKQEAIKRMVCFGCYEKLMAKGYDGQYYDEADECLDKDY